MRVIFWAGLMLCGCADELRIRSVRTCLDKPHFPSLRKGLSYLEIRINPALDLHWDLFFCGFYSYLPSEINP